MPIPATRDSLRRALEVGAPDKSRIQLTYLTASDVGVAAGEDTCTGALEPFVANNKEPRPLRSVLRSVRRHWGAVVLCEHPYMDLEFWDAHAGLYGRCFKPFGIACIRLHFFSSATSRAHPSEPYDEAFAKCLCRLLKSGATLHPGDVSDTELPYEGAQYDGYCILRPTQHFVVSRTAIRFDETPFADRPRDNAGELVAPMHAAEADTAPILNIRQRCEANLLNAHFTTDTAEFIQQDPHLGPCATASLWVVTRTVATSSHLGPRYPYSSLTRSAIGPEPNVAPTDVLYDPNAGDHGLTTSQIRHTLMNTGWRTADIAAAADREPSHESRRIRHDIVSYLDSGYPAILCVFDEESDIGHAVAAVGYAHPTSHVPKPEGMNAYLEQQFEFNPNEHSYCLFGDTVPLVYVHDDRYGPFNRLVFKNSHHHDLTRTKSRCKHCKQLLGDPLVCLECGSGIAKEAERYPEVFLKKRPYRLHTAVVPLPTNVRQAPLAGLSEAVRHFDQYYAEYYNAEFGDPVFLWRSVLCRGSDFKCSLSSRRYPEPLLARFAAEHLPEYIWAHEVAIVTDEQEWCAAGVEVDRFIDGEYLYDATAPFFHIAPLVHRLGQSVAGIKSGAHEPIDKRDIKPLPDAILSYDPRKRAIWARE